MNPFYAAYQCVGSQRGLWDYRVVNIAETGNLYSITSTDGKRIFQGTFSCSEIIPAGRYRFQSAPAAVSAPVRIQEGVIHMGSVTLKGIEVPYPPTEKLWSEEPPVELTGFRAALRGHAGEVSLWKSSGNTLYLNGRAVAQYSGIQLAWNTNLFPRCLRPKKVIFYPGGFELSGPGWRYLQLGYKPAWYAEEREKQRNALGVAIDAVPKSYKEELRKRAMRHFDIALSGTTSLKRGIEDIVAFYGTDPLRYAEELRDLARGGYCSTTGCPVYNIPGNRVVEERGYIDLHESSKRGRKIPPHLQRILDLTWTPVKEIKAAGSKISFDGILVNPADVIVGKVWVAENLVAIKAPDRRRVIGVKYEKVNRKGIQC